MSYTPYQSASYRSKPQPVVKKFCKVCQDAGKSESEYTSHNVRETKDPNSRLLCPTLLALECRNCFKKGHTVKYCSLLKKQQLQQQISANAPPKKQDQKQGQGRNQTQKNVFMLLESDSEDDQEGREEPIKQKLAPTPVANAALKKSAMNYKSIIAITEKQVKEEEESARLARFRKQEDQYAKMKSKMTKTTWADAESSEDEDEDEEQAEN
jgi:hypothetical protein